LVSPVSGEENNRVGSGMHQDPECSGTLVPADLPGILVER